MHILHIYICIEMQPLWPKQFQGIVVVHRGGDLSSQLCSHSWSRNPSYGCTAIVSYG